MRLKKFAESTKLFSPKQNLTIFLKKGSAYFGSDSTVFLGYPETCHTIDLSLLFLCLDFADSQNFLLVCDVFLP